MSLDGKIGSATNPGCSISSPEGKEFGQNLRVRADALLVGAGTILADDPLLTYRGKAPKAGPLVRVILDEALQTPPSARIFESKTPLLIFTSLRSSQSRRKALEQRGAEVIAVPSSGSEELDLSAVLKELGDRNMLCILVEGGSLVHWSFIANNLVDLFYFIVSPFVLGGKDAVPAVGGRGFASAEDALQFKIRNTFSVGPDLVLEAYPACSRSIISPWLSR
jgi:diaminohydroxyphosphoribosylaminopyrimidine deaminase/5-amino-6-(5-phosphoribosylamino)uracil reductase